jgi:hypothetical protein
LLNDHDLWSSFSGDSDTSTDKPLILR